MRESRTPGSVRGAVSNHRPYRDHLIVQLELRWFSVQHRARRPYRNIAELKPIECTVTVIALQPEYHCRVEEHRAGPNVYGRISLFA